MSLVPLQALADSLHVHRNDIVELDYRIYPSTSMKSGISTQVVGQEVCRNPCHRRWTDRGFEETLDAVGTGGRPSTK